MGVELCAVQVRFFQIKCHKLPVPHVDTMLGVPQMRGLKRKFDQAAGEEENFSDFICSHQRQSIFNMSMCKLTRFRQAPDPSLLRSVLICNTLRNIEREMEREGLRLNCCFNASLLQSCTKQNNSSALGHNSDPRIVPDSAHLTLLNCNSRANPYHNSSEHSYAAANNNNTTTNNHSSSSEYEKCLLEIEPLTGRATPFQKSVYDRVDSGALWNEDSDRLTSLNWSSVLNFNLSGSSQSSFSSNHNTKSNSDCGATETSLHTLMPPLNGDSAMLCSAATRTTLASYSSSMLSINSSSSSGSNGSDEIFGDIDLSLYDFDLLSPLSPPNVKLAPVSAEELMRSLTGANEALLASSSCQSESILKSELFSDERDHVTPVMT